MLFYTFWNLEPILFFAHPNMKSGLDNTGIRQGAWFEFDNIRLIRVEVINTIAAMWAEFGTVGVAAVSWAFPMF